MKGTKTIIFVVLISIVITQFLAIVLMNQKAYVTFDLDKTNKDFLVQMYKKHLPKSESDKLVKEYAAALTFATQDYAKKNNAIVFINKAVVSGAYNATPEIKKLISQDMKYIVKNNTDNKFVR